MTNPFRYTMLAALGLTGAIGLSAILMACGGGVAKGAAGQKDPTAWPSDDKSMCKWKGRTDVEVAEISGTGSLKPNIRRVFKLLGDVEHQHKQLECREIDTNLDGVKDIARFYNEKGEAAREDADTNFDGKIDQWVLFVDGKMAEIQIDTNNDGKPDVWKFYSEGNLIRIKRDKNHDGNVDTWEMYARGKLERMGVDENFDGHVDRWDRDDQLIRDAEETDKKTRAAMEAIKDGGAPPPSAGADAGK